MPQLYRLFAARDLETDDSWQDRPLLSLFLVFFLWMRKGSGTKEEYISNGKRRKRYNGGR